MNELPKKLLAADEPAPVLVCNADGESPFVLVADHAGNIMPRALRHWVLPRRNANGTSPWTSALPVSAGFWRTRSTRESPFFFHGNARGRDFEFCSSAFRDRAPAPRRPI